MQSRTVSDIVLTDYRYEPSAIVRPHSHESAYFSFVLSGAYRENCLGAGYHECSTYATVYHPPGEKHSDVFGNRGGRLFSLEVGSETLQLARDYELCLDRRISLKQPRIETRMRFAYKAFLDARPQSALVLRSMAMELLYLLPWKRPVCAEARQARWLDRVIDILHAEFHQPPCLTALAQSVGTHPVHLARSFKRRWGLTIGDYIRKIRVEKAIQVLQSSNKELVAIAADCGFCDQSHFGRIFKAATGMTPLQFRNQKR